MNKNKRYSLLVICFLSTCLFIVAGLTIYIDPYFHYHLSNKKNIHLVYDVNNQRYQNDGIMRYSDYNAMITGTSMSENFKTSEFDKLFNVKSIKVPFSGASYKEINDNIQRAIYYNKNIKYIIRSLDYSYFYTSADNMRYEDSYYPKYLTNDNLFDDVYYLYNKSVIIKIFSILNTYDKNNNNTDINFDQIYNWNDSYQFNKETVLSTYTRSNKILEKVLPTSQEIEDFKENININLVQTVKENPNVQFYYFLTPYSICWWDTVYQENRLDKHLYGEQMIIEALIPYDNVHLFSFSNDFEIITNLDNYKDQAHYSESINTYMLEKMSKNENRLTKDNYKHYLKEIYDFYSFYDYDSIYK